MISFGQDECIFKPFLVNKKAWNRNGKFCIQSKDDGVGIMVSAFQSREFGFGMEILDEDFLKGVCHVFINKTNNQFKTMITKYSNLNF